MGFYSPLVSVPDDVSILLGTDSPAELQWDAIDANANLLKLELPAGGAVDVPVLLIGRGIIDNDLGLYNGVVATTLAIWENSTGTEAPVWEFRKSRGSATTPTAIVSGDNLGAINAYGYSGSSGYVEAVSLEFDSEGTIGPDGTARVGGVFRVRTATDAAPSVLTTALTVDSAQRSTFAGVVVVNDDLRLALGTDLDNVLYHRTASLGANTGIATVLVGTVVADALAANSLILSNVTASGDLVIAANRGGNSESYLWIDSSTGELRLYSRGTGVMALNSDGLTNVVIGSATARGDTPGFTVDRNVNAVPDIFNFANLNTGTGAGIAITASFADTASTVSLARILRIVKGGTWDATAANKDIDVVFLTLEDNIITTYMTFDSSVPEINIAKPVNLASTIGDVPMRTGTRIYSAGSSSISVVGTQPTIGSLGTIVIPVKTDTGEATDAQIGNAVGAIYYNTFDNNFGLRDVADNPQVVGVSGYIIQSHTPEMSAHRGTYHPAQYWNDPVDCLGRRSVDETRCVVCGEFIVPGDGVLMWANGYQQADIAHPERPNVHAIFGHPHLERDTVILSMLQRIKELESERNGFYHVLHRPPGSSPPQLILAD